MRVGRVVGIKKDCLQEYIQAHEEVPDFIRRSLIKSGVNNYTLFHWNNIVFSYFETTNDFSWKTFTENSFSASDENRRWEKEMEDLQYPLFDAEEENDSGSWRNIEEIWHFRW